MQFRHLCSVYRKIGGTNPIGGDRKDIDPVPDMQEQVCLFSTKTIFGQSDQDAESFQGEIAMLLFPIDTDVLKGDVIKNIRYGNGEIFKTESYTVETFSDKPSLITGPHHKTAILHEI